jgi:predicted branched-subunit amino acid permease
MKQIERELIADMQHSKGVTVWFFVSLLGAFGLLFYYYPKALWGLVVLIPYIFVWLCWEGLIKLARRNGHTQFRKYQKL